MPYLLRNKTSSSFKNEMFSLFSLSMNKMICSFMNDMAVCSVVSKTRWFVHCSFTNKILHSFNCFVQFKMFLFTNFRNEMRVKCSNFAVPRGQSFIDSRRLDLDKRPRRFKLTAKELKAERSVDWDCSQNHQPQAQKWPDLPPILLTCFQKHTAQLPSRLTLNKTVISIVRVHQTGTVKWCQVLTWVVRNTLSRNINSV